VTTQNTSEYSKKVEEQRFEFSLFINNHIICQRYFNVRDYNEDSIKSLEMKELIDNIVGVNNGTFGEIGSSRYNKLAGLDYWRSDNPSNTFFGVVAANPYRNAIFYQDASFLRISDITLGYNFSPKVLSALKMGSARIYGQVSNPFVFSDFTGFDPEFNSAIFQDDVPSMIYTFGVSISF
jgi:hypothetical protein